MGFVNGGLWWSFSAYLPEMAPEARRSIYLATSGILASVTVFNPVIAGALFEALPPEGVFGGASLIAVVGLALAWTLRQGTAGGRTRCGRLPAAVCRGTGVYDQQVSSPGAGDHRLAVIAVRRASVIALQVPGTMSCAIRPWCSRSPGRKRTADQVSSMEICETGRMPTSDSKPHIASRLRSVFTFALPLG